MRLTNLLYKWNRISEFNLTFDRFRFGRFPFHVVQLEDMKFGLMPTPPTTTPYTNPSTASTSPSSSLPHSRKNSCNNNTINMSINSLNATSDFNQWLHAMKMVARLPGGTPPEFRRKLWLALADRHLHTSGIDWNKEQTKCLSSETWLDDDEELGVQIVKDLHRTGSSLFTGPNGQINQAKLKRVLLGYARWNPEVGYCQVNNNKYIIRFWIFE